MARLVGRRKGSQNLSPPHPRQKEARHWVGAAGQGGPSLAGLFRGGALRARTSLAPAWAIPAPPTLI